MQNPIEVYEEGRTWYVREVGRARPQGSYENKSAAVEAGKALASMEHTDLVVRDGRG
ncbi:DUF2188 domain-containing protein [Rothia sp. AR01]|uniref:DUF2188 domain-containing protein n=1 Tax=Rothia santali TaxID=2949643 RepID=A0A9X2HBD4_9MICC|nr:DUF2188 domain-containing protein [Rothia santali]MCP3424572.1 DUF2188 domain-containing protein [Rothia santali]